MNQSHYCVKSALARDLYLMEKIYAEGYTLLMVALHRGRLECAKALLRAGADPNYVNGAGDLVIFWAIDGGVECIKLLSECANRIAACLLFVALKLTNRFCELLR